MDRRCYGCASKFTVFRKECGCKNCGRAFCSSCLGFSAIVPRCGNTQQKVCKQCHGELTRGVSQTKTAKWSPPENYKKRVAALEAKQNQWMGPQNAPVKPQSRAGSKYQGLSKEDRAIAERLERLKEETKPKSIPSQAEIESRLAALKDDPRKPVPSTQEMEDRLAALKGRTLPSKTPKPVHQPPDVRTHIQQSDDLLTQLAEEVAIEESYRPEAQPQAVNTQTLNDLNRISESSIGTADLDPKQLEEEKNKLLAEAAAELREANTREEKILEVAKRLAVLRGQDPEKVTLEDYKLPDSDEELTEEEAIQRVLKQLTEEAALDEASGFNIPADQATRPATSRQFLPKKAKLKNQIPAATGGTKKPSRIATAEDSDDEELPWCCICNEDATLRCHDCDDDLYCQRCFREGHDEFDRKEHRTSSCCPPRKQK
uniref:Zinc finger FYVE-type containing 19 n=1 Tax=Pelodiscus sinensis TaxID=13735 RepID=K7G4F6_PELSI|nr:abscission/NoCut checkpoint regulator isoform X1 [Pelodiscus sinensis]XP_006128742.1 abscission/NoCut checkpoint regulator isoform X1 [Pelodiscus sinensis]XP_006128743.1 abscission/NoCut checkpoint regulator isoform X1 [Pelodiscus sinensis]XP_014431816.1 abscission/NoCut checkpoint regulator isoform X1 [Pelodiscus sinensis]|eukprot:XP_006128741.1 abscission/NoCut checkpoint regulator isoform X1 [Pelodiscus sinensis]